MLESIKNLYQASELPGEVLHLPLKAYNNFFAEKFNRCSPCLQKLAWRISVVIAYPVLGILAGIGLLVKLRGAANVEKHNEKTKALTKESLLSFLETANLQKTYPEHIKGLELNERDLVKFDDKYITPTTVASSLTFANQTIDNLTKQYKKAYVETKLCPDRCYRDNEGNQKPTLKIFIYFKKS